MGNSLGRDDRVDGGKLWEIVWGELRWEGARRKRHEATTRWTEGKPWEIAWGELRWEGARTEATTGWTEGKPWEIAWGELRWEGAGWNHRCGGRTGNRGK